MRETRGIWRGKRLGDGKWLNGLLADRNFRRSSALLYNEKDCEEFWVDLSTLGEFTGLTDRSGKFVFEGDVIQYETQGVLERYIVVWNNESACFAVKGLSGLLVGDFTFFDPQRCEIIGNIYDNLTEYGSELVDKMEV